MRYRFIEEHRGCGLRIESICASVNISASSYYDWRKRGISKRAEANAELLAEIRSIYEHSRGTYGSPRINKELHSRGYRCGEHRVARLMRKHGIQAKTKRQFRIRTTQRRETDPVAANLVQQKFVADRPNQLWSSDITYLWTREGWLYLAVVLDVFSRQIVGYALKNRLTTDLVTDAFKRAVGWRAIEQGMILHSDRGCQYTSQEFQRLLDAHGVRSSMSGSGNCYDNAITETFFHTLKTEHIYFERYETRRHAEQSIFEYIEVFYNRQRRHSALGYKSPVEFELHSTMS